MIVVTLTGVPPHFGGSNDFKITFHRTWKSCPIFCFKTVTLELSAARGSKRERERLAEGNERAVMYGGKCRFHA